MSSELIDALAQHATDLTDDIRFAATREDHIRRSARAAQAHSLLEQARSENQASSHALSLVPPGP